ncbi:hypothetical protein [Bacillus testis]|nr:hypothetical protein [Bacillus testis]
MNIQRLGCIEIVERSGLLKGSKAEGSWFLQRLIDEYVSAANRFNGKTYI